MLFLQVQKIALQEIQMYSATTREGTSSGSEHMRLADLQETPRLRHTKKTASHPHPLIMPKRDNHLHSLFVRVRAIVHTLSIHIWI